MLNQHFPNQFSPIQMRSVVFFVSVPIISLVILQLVFAFKVEEEKKIKNDFLVYCSTKGDNYFLIKGISRKRYFQLQNSITWLLHTTCSTILISLLIPVCETLKKKQHLKRNGNKRKIGIFWIVWSWINKTGRIYNLSIRR